MTQSEPCKDCKSHSGIEQAIKDLEKDVESASINGNSRGLALGKKLSTSWFTWVFGLLIAVVGTIFGVLWAGQGKLENSVTVGHKEVMQSLGALRTEAAVNGVKIVHLSEQMKTHIDESQKDRRR